MIRGIIYLICVLILPGCCTKKACPGESLPQIEITFNNLNSNNYHITSYTVKNGQQIGAQEYSSDGPITLENTRLVLTPFSDYDISTASGLYFVIKRENRSDTIRNFQLEFKQVKIVCNKCFPLGSEKETVWQYDNFSYYVNSRLETKSALVLEY
jgi:hypothetical protein